MRNECRLHSLSKLPDIGNVGTAFDAMLPPWIVDMDRDTFFSSDSTPQVTSGVEYAVPTREERRSRFIRATQIDPTESKPKTVWPATSRYFDPLIMDAESIAKLLEEDTLYANEEHPWCLDYACVTDSTLYHRQTQANDCHETGIFSAKVLNSRLTLVHIRQRRLYLKGDTTSAISVDTLMWLALLKRFEILPSFVELLHDNNGCTLAHISYEQTTGREDRPGPMAPNERTPDAFHVGYKMGSAMDEEYAIYARQSLKTGCTVIFVLGTDPSAAQTSALRLLKAEPHASLFHVIFALQSTILTKLERIRWRLDYMTQDFEAETGFTTLKRPGTVTPQKLQHVGWNRDKIVAAWEPRFLKWGSARIILNFKALLRHIDMYGKISKHQPNDPGVAELDNLRTACKMKVELAQSQHDNTLELQSRLNSQLDAIRTLKDQRDTDLNIQIAKATKHDSETNVQIAMAVQHESELMRRITLITMLFLPATFVATFFSMVFFQNTGRLVETVYQIWWFPAVSIPLTLIITLCLFARSKKALCETVRALCRTITDFYTLRQPSRNQYEQNGSIATPEGTQTTRSNETSGFGSEQSC